MKTSRLILAALLTAAAPFNLSAATLVWDRNGTTAGAGATPNGTWDTSGPNWNTDPAGVLTPGLWSNGNVAVFSAGSDATGAFTVNLPASQSPSGVVIEEGDISFTGNIINVGAGQFTINTGARASITAADRISSTGGVLLDGGTIRNTNPTNGLSFLPASTPIVVGANGGAVDYTSSGTGTFTIYTGLIKGTGVLTKSGANEFRYNGSATNDRANTTFTKLVVAEGSFRLGTVVGFDTELGFGAAPATFTADAITLSGGGSIGTFFTTTLNDNRGITLGTGGGAINATSGSMTVPGAITGSGSLTTTSATGVNATSVTLSGANTYSGGTTVNSGTLNATGASPLGDPTGPLSVNNLNTGASGTSVVLNLSTTAPTITGSLSGTKASAGSTNTLTINNGGQPFTVNQTTAGTFAGVIAGTGPFTLGNLSTDALTLTGANTYSGGTTVSGGELILGAPNASLGTGDVTVESGGKSLTIQTGVLNAIANLASLSLAGGGTAGTADVGYVNLATGVNERVYKLVLGGVTQALGTYGSTLSSAAFKDDEYFSGTGILTVLPEPGAAITMLSGVGLLVTLRRRRW